MTYRFEPGAETELPITAGASVNFSATITLPPRLVTIIVTAYDKAGNATRAVVSVRYSVSRLIGAHTGIFDSTPDQLVVIDSDGDGRRNIVAVHVTSDRRAYPSWDPTQTNIAFQNGGRIYLAGESGNVARLMPTSRFDAESSPQFSVDGQWIYFAAGNLSLLTGAVPEALWRVRPDGSGLQQISPNVDPYSNYDYPSPSPDGSRVVFLSNGYPYDPRVHVLDVASRTVTSLNVLGYTPRWSPTSGTIAFIDGTGRTDGLGVVTVMNIDGGGRRVVSPTGSVYTVGLAWSRDGTMILARNFGAQRFETINAATGVVAPIANTSTLFGPGW